MSATDFASKKVLIVDDDKMIVQLVTIVLQGLGFETIFSSLDSREGLALLKDKMRDIDLLLLDLMMPEIDGIKFLRELDKMNFAGAIVLMSGTDRQILNALERVGSKRLNILGALEKPITPIKLRPVVERIEDSNRCQQLEDTAKRSQASAISSCFRALKQSSVVSAKAIKKF